MYSWYFFWASGLLVGGWVVVGVVVVGVLAVLLGGGFCSDCTSVSVELGLGLSSGFG